MRARNGEPLRWLLEHANHRGKECLIWPFGKSGGRGVICFEGKMGLASRAMCKIAHGPAPRNKPEAAHSCGKAHLACVHPGHLRWASKIENHTDKIGHGTLLQGSQIHQSKLVESDVRRIKTRLSRGEKGQDIAEIFGVHKATISDIKVGKTWRHVD